MKKKSRWLLILSLGLSLSSILIHNLMVDIPSWIAIIVALVAAIALIAYINKN